ncbi:MAG: redox-regulated ATPase YchF [Acholeplasmatales bacterium]|nr:MAG: redox-regulated ATPase YchF [Acholeplasmatales bacterium]
MPMTAGIIGLPNIGKSTLFNALTKAGALAANYPFATIHPNVANVLVPDPRLNDIAELVHPKRIVPTTFEFTDIAGLVRGASRGEGLGNQFLSHIREVDALLHVVRCFEEDDVVHVEGSLDPIRDIETVEFELTVADYDIVEKRLPKLAKQVQLKPEPLLVQELALLKRIEGALQAGQPIRALALTDVEYRLIRGYGFITAKPIIYVANMSEEAWLMQQPGPLAEKVVAHAQTHQQEVVMISAQIEAELATLEATEKQEFLQAYGLAESGLDALIAKAYAQIGYQTFFTAGPQEARAWTFRKGMSAAECAGIIHSDFARGFIRAETVHVNELLKAGSLLHAKEKGLVRAEGKGYTVQDGDIILFRFNV